MDAAYIYVKQKNALSTPFKKSGFLEKCIGNFARKNFKIQNLMPKVFFKFLLKKCTYIGGFSPNPFLIYFYKKISYHILFGA